MSRRALVVLGLLAAAALVGVWLTRDEPQAPTSATGERFVPELLERINDVTRVTIRGRGGDVVAELEPDEAGDWRVTNRWNYAANRAALRGTLIALAEARRAEARTADPEGWRRLGVDDVAGADADGMEIGLRFPTDALTVVIGGAGPAGRGSYARRTDEDRAWLLDRLIERRTAVSDWLDAQLVDIPADRVARVDIEPAEGAPVRVRTDDSDVSGFRLLDVPADVTLLTPTIARSLALVVRELRLTDVWPRARAGSMEPVAVARYETDDGLIVWLRTFVMANDGGVEVARLEADVTDGADGDTAARARALTAAWEGWVYRLPEHKFVNASHDLDRIIERPPDVE